MIRTTFAKHLLTILLISAIRVPSSAQIAEWVISPEFGQIEKYSENVYKVTSFNGKSWLQLENGQKVYDPMSEGAFNAAYDSISPVIGGFGLLMDYDQPKAAWRLMGIFDSANKSVKNIADKEKYYIGEFGFFSERLLPVKKDNKKYGYITPEDNIAVKFNYETALPFSQGKAAVSKDASKIAFRNLLGGNNQKQQNYFYIDYYGNENPFPPAAGKKFILCTTFCEDEATIINNQGQAFKINDKLQPTMSIDANNIKLDDAGINIAATPNTQRIGMPEELNHDSEGITKLTRNNLTGYEKDGKILIQPQFTGGGEFDKGYVAVSTKKGSGLLHLAPDTLKVELRESERKIAQDSLENLIIKCNIPAQLIDKIALTDTAGRSVLFSKLSPNEIEFVTPKAQNVRFSVFGKHNLLMLDTLLKTPAFLLMEKQKQEEDNSEFLIAVSPLSVTSNAKNLAVVGVTVTNNSAETKNVAISISGKGLNGGNYKVKLAPGKSKTYYPTFTKIVRKENRTITVVAGSKKVVKTIQVNPKSVSL